MPIPLKDPIATYFRSANAHESAALTACFAPDAIVQDEGREYRGLPQIMEWNERTSRQYALTLEPVSAQENGDQVFVTALATGDFDGSPAESRSHSR